MNMVAAPEKTPTSNCDRYGHPLREAEATPVADEALEHYLSHMEGPVTERWSQLYRKLYDDRGASISQEELVAVIQATLRDLCRDGSGRLPTFADGLRRSVQRRVCLAGWECHGYLVPTQDWEDREDLGAVRAALKHKLLRLLDYLIA